MEIDGMSGKENKWNRRDLLCSLGRTAALCGLVSIGKMAMNPSRAASPEAPCKTVTPCRECKIFDYCSLPQANSSRLQSKERTRE